MVEAEDTMLDEVLPRAELHHQLFDSPSGAIRHRTAGTPVLGPRDRCCVCVRYSPFPTALYCNTECKITRRRSSAGAGIYAIIRTYLGPTCLA